MPIFEYRCDDCGEKTEKIQTRSLAEINCPACGKKARRLVSLSGAPRTATGDGCATSASSGFG